VEKEKLLIDGQAVLDVSSVPDQEVFVAIRPEGFVLDEKGPLICSLTEVEVMGRDITVVSSHACSDNTEIRSIISSENYSDVSGAEVRFSLKPNKVHIFSNLTQERINCHRN